MKYAVYLLAIVFLLSLNLGLFNNLQIRGQTPNLLFLFSLYFAFEKKDLDFFFVGFVCGLILDFYSTTFFGSFTFSFLIITLGLHLFVNNLASVELNWKTLSFSLLVCLFALDILVWLYSAAAFKLSWTQDSSGFKQYMAMFPLNFLYNLLFLYPVYVFANFLKNFTDSLSARRRSVIN
jgi:rod shape-determining protein MreD